MKYISVFLALVLFSCQPPETSKEEKPITEAEVQIAKGLIQGAFDDLWAAADSTKMSKYHTEDFILLEHGEIWDNDRIREYMRKRNARTNRAKRINKMEYISVEKYGKSMQIAYHNFADFLQADTVAGKGQWLESALAVETPEGWRLKMMHSTRVPTNK